MSLIPCIKINKNKKRYIPNKLLNKNFLKYFFLKDKLINLVNSTNDKEKIIIDINKYTILLTNIRISNNSKSRPVFILLYISDFN